MKHYLKSTGLALALGLGIASGAFALEQPFQAMALRDSVTKDKAGYFISTMSGEAVEFGEFVGVSHIKCKGHHCLGPVVLDLGGGNTLTFLTHLKFDSHFQLGEGTYVIMSGTGLFEGAAGKGYFSVDERAGHDHALITWNGTINY